MGVLELYRCKAESRRAILQVRRGLVYFPPLLLPLSNDKQVRDALTGAKPPPVWHRGLASGPLPVGNPSKVGNRRARRSVATRQLQMKPSREGSGPPPLEITQQRPHSSQKSLGKRRHVSGCLFANK